MKPDEEKKLVDALTALGLAFDKPMSKPLIAAYRMALEDLPIEAIGAACKRAMKELKWFPKPVEIRELCGIVGPAQRAVIAWDAFADAVKKHGFYRSVDFSDKAINATVRALGGWQRVCTIADPKEFDTFLRRDFERTYLAIFANGAVSAEQAAPLVGYAEEQNRINGYSGKDFQGVGLNAVASVPVLLPEAKLRIVGQITQGQIGARYGANLKVLGSE